MILDILKKASGRLSERFILTPEFERVLNILEKSNDNFFITGKAGTGKSTLIQYFRKSTKKNVVILAPTGLAALNIRGQTIHSFFKFPPRMISKEMIKAARDKSIYTKVDTVIVDEASMLRADLLDAIDLFLRKNGRDAMLPFGGAQIVLVGDLFQLPPVVNFEEKNVFSKLYETPYFFSSNVFQQADFKTVELQEVFRQKDIDFINVLDMVRSGNITSRGLQPINSQVTDLINIDDSITLCPTNKLVDAINSTKLNEIDQKEFMFEARVEGVFSDNEKAWPINKDLKLKKGARVLFVKNDRGGRWVNGSLGVVHDLEEDYVRVRLDDSKEIVDVGIDSWDNIKYQYNTRENKIEEDVVGRLMQYPLKLAWAITVHKSQGMTFDKVCIDFRRSPFAHGQTYVALSRCRSLEGISLTKEIWPNDVIVDERVVNFMSADYSITQNTFSD